MLAMIRFLFFFFVLFALFSLSAPVCFADVGLKDSPPSFSNLKRHPIPDSTIGQKGNTYISPVGSTPATKFAKTPSGGLGRNLLKFGKFLGRGGPTSIAAQFAVGVTANIAVDLGKAYLDKKLQDYPVLRDPLDDALGIPDDPLANACGNVVITGGPGKGSYCTSDPVPPDDIYKCPTSTSPSGSFTRFRIVKNESKCCSSHISSCGMHMVHSEYYTVRRVESDADPGSEPNPTVYPDKLSDDQLKNLVNKLNDLLQKNDQLANDIADALDDLINKDPEYLDWDPIPSRDFEDALLQDKIDETLQARSNATDPDEIKRLDDLLEKLANQKNRLDLNRQKEDEDQKKKADKTPDTDNCNDNNNNCNNNNCNNNCNNCPDGKCEVECKIEETPFEPPAVPKPELKEIDFQPITDLQGRLMQKFPFCLLTAFGSALDVLSASPTAPRCELNLGVGTITFDLSFLDSFAAFIRAVMSFCIFGLCGFGCFRMWSRF